MADFTKIYLFIVNKTKLVLFLVKIIQSIMLIVESRPAWTLDKVVEISKSKYNLEIIGKVQELPSYLDQNFVFTAKDTKKYVLKIANPSEDLEVLEMQNMAMRHLANKGFENNLLEHSMLKSI